mmetsp:Transcript_25683/g.37678  ORF Transcript_25683/g.37678 Transcript_25683/m.37678 type:complete len:335 (+) Transcript_25683:1146-2150(+)
METEEERGEGEEKEVEGEEQEQEQEQEEDEEEGTPFTADLAFQKSIDDVDIDLQRARDCIAWGKVTSFHKVREEVINGIAQAKELIAPTDPDNPRTFRNTEMHLNVQQRETELAEIYTCLKESQKSKNTVARCKEVYEFPVYDLLRDNVIAVLSVLVQLLDSSLSKKLGRFDSELGENSPQTPGLLWNVLSKAWQRNAELSSMVVEKMDGDAWSPALMDYLQVYEALEKQLDAEMAEKPHGALFEVMKNCVKSDLLDLKKPSIDLLESFLEASMEMQAKLDEDRQLYQEQKWFDECSSGLKKATVHQLCGSSATLTPPPVVVTPLLPPSAYFSR